MVKKQFWMGMLVLLLVLGMLIVGCSSDSATNDDKANGAMGESEWMFINESSYTIMVEGISPPVGNSITPNTFELAPGAYQKVRGTSNFTSFTYVWYRKDTLDRTGVSVSSLWGDVRSTWYRSNLYYIELFQNSVSFKKALVKLSN